MTPTTATCTNCDSTNMKRLGRRYRGPSPDHVPLLDDETTIANAECADCGAWLRIPSDHPAAE